MATESPRLLGSRALCFWGLRGAKGREEFSQLTAKLSRAELSGSSGEMLDAAGLAASLPAPRCVFQAGLIKTSSSSTRAQSRSWPRSRATPRRSPASCSTPLRCAAVPSGLFLRGQTCPDRAPRVFLWPDPAFSSFQTEARWCFGVNLPASPLFRSWCSRLLPMLPSGSGLCPTPPACRLCVPTRAP